MQPFTTCSGTRKSDLTARVEAGDLLFHKMLPGRCCSRPVRRSGKVIQESVLKQANKFFTNRYPDAAVSDLFGNQEKEPERAH